MSLNKKILFHEVIAIVAIVVMLEVGLRMFPSVIPLPLLQGFEFDLRARIAGERDLETNKDINTISSELFHISAEVFKPFTEVKSKSIDSGSTPLVSMDAQGFCNPPGGVYEHSTIEILALGDSFTWCTSIDPKDTWPLQLGEKTGMSSYNLGQRGMGPYRELIVLEQFGLEKRPTFVVMGFYEGNDLRDAKNARNRIEKQKTGERINDVVTYPCKVKPAFICTLHRKIQDSFIGKRSYTYSLLSAAAKLFVQELAGDTTTRLGKGAGIYSDFRYQIQTPNGSTIVANPENTDVDELGYAEQARRGEVSFTLYDEALETYRQLGKEHSFIPTILYIPTLYTTYSNFIEFSDPRVRELVEWFSDEQRNYLKAKSEELGIVFIDPTPILKEKARDHRTLSTLLYFPINLHPTPRGHEALAEYVKTVLLNIPL